MKTKPKFIIQTSSDNELQQPFSIKFTDLIQGSLFGGELKGLKITSDTINMIQFTSGTTGRPKAATLTNQNLVNNVIGFGRRTGMCLPGQIYNVNVPLFHCFGSVLGSLSSLIFRNTCVFPAPKFSAQAGIDATMKEKCTVQMGTPTMYMDIFALSSNPQNSGKIKTSKMGVIAGSLCPPEVAKEASSHGIDIINVYGSTENSPIVTGMFKDSTYDQKINTVGYPIEHQEIKVVGEDGQVVPIDKRGEIWFRGPNLMEGYWNDPVKTKSSITEDGWYKSGDIASIDKNGYVKIYGRNDDMFQRGGENIYPAETEDCLLSHEVVFNAQVIGVPDKRLGNEVGVYLTLTENSFTADNEVIEMLKKYCEGKIAAYKVPKYWKILKSLPTTTTGKVQKYKLREMAKTDFL